MKSFILLFLIYFSSFSFSASKCYQNKIVSITDHQELSVLVTFEKAINNSNVYLFKNTHCSRFYDSLICDYESDLLPEWKISSDSDMTTDWFIDYCIDSNL